MIALPTVMEARGGSMTATTTPNLTAMTPTPPSKTLILIVGESVDVVVVGRPVVTHIMIVDLIETDETIAIEIIVIESAMSAATVTVIVITFAEIETAGVLRMTGVLRITGILEIVDIEKVGIREMIDSLETLPPSACVSQTFPMTSTKRWYVTCALHHAHPHALARR